MKKSKIYWIVIVALLIIFAGGYFLLSNSKKGLQYNLGKIDRGDIVINISATGTLNAVTTVQVGSQVSGTIAKLYADFNSVVKEGQLLAQLDPTFLQASVNEQRANVDRARAQVNESKRNVDRTTQLFSKSLISQVDLDAAITADESSQAGLKQAEASLQRAEVNLKYATILAPISGVVISRNVDVGQTVAASLQAPTLFSIANDLKKMQVEASVDEADIGSVKVDQPVTFRVDAYPDNQFEGKVSQIRLSPIISQNVVTYNVIIDVDNPEVKLMPGMTATVSIEVARRDNVLRVPLQALRFTPAEIEQSADEKKSGGTQEGKNALMAAGPPQGMPNGEQKSSGGNGNRNRVWTLVKGRPTPVMIMKGIQNAKYAEITKSDIKEGDEVIIGAIDTASKPAVQGQNPFAPRMPGGGRGGH